MLVFVYASALFTNSHEARITTVASQRGYRSSHKARITVAGEVIVPTTRGYTGYKGLHGLTYPLKL